MTGNKPRRLLLLPNSSDAFQLENHKQKVGRPNETDRWDDLTLGLHKTDTQVLGLT